MSSYIIGIDIGTGSTKAVAVNKAGVVLAITQAAYPTLHLQPGYSEQEPEAIWQAFIHCVQSITDQVGQQPTAISFSSAMHSIMAIDGEGIPMMPLITWADTRSEKTATDIRQSANAENLYRDTGAPLHAMTPLCKITWFHQHQPEVIATAFKFLSIKEYIWYRLFDTFEIDYSIASASGLFHIHEKKWHPGALQLTGLSLRQLSTPVPTTYTRSNVSERIASMLHLSSDTLFCIGASDGCLANLGSFATERGIAAVTIGTSGAVRIASSAPLFRYDAMLFNYILNNETFVCGGPINNGGNVMQWLLQQFLQEKSSPEQYQQVFTQIEKVPAGCEGLIFLPYLHGERAPIWDEKSCGAFFGIRQLHGKAHFMRAALEGVCFAVKNVLQIVEQASGTIKQIQISGGFVHSDAWVQTMADITGKKLCLVQSEDASALGAAFLAMKEMDWISDFSALKPAEGKMIFPNEGTYPVYQKNFDIFRQLYPLLRENMHQLLS